MDKFNRGGDRGGSRGGFGGDRGGRPSFGGNRGGGYGGNKFGGNRGGGDRPPVTMHDATCDDCKKKCQVPFRPSGDKPVYCNDCFGGKREGGDRPQRREFNERPAPQASFSRPAEGQSDVKKQLDAINLKLDNLIRTVEMMSKPSQVEKKIVIKVGEKKPKIVAKKKSK